MHRTTTFFSIKVLAMVQRLPLIFASVFFCSSVAQQTRCVAQQKQLQAVQTTAKAPTLDAHEYVWTQAGQLPIILSAPHGGGLAVEGVPVRTGAGLETGPAGFTTVRDTGTEELTMAVAKAIEQKFGRPPYVVLSRLNRKYMDPNRPARIAYESPAIEPIYGRYHQLLNDYCRAVATEFGRGLLLDIHGQSSRADTVFRGTKNGFTVARLRQSYGEQAHTGPQSLFGLLKSQGWTVFPDPHDGQEQSGFTGGYIVQTYGSGAAWSKEPSPNPNGSNGSQQVGGETSQQGLRSIAPSKDSSLIDAIQLEFGSQYRKQAMRQTTARQLTEALWQFAVLYLPAAIEAPQEQVSPENRAHVTNPPESYFDKVRDSDRDAARQFYKKYIDIRGVPCTASGEVDDAALLRTYEIVTRMLVNRPDILDTMANNGTRLIIIGKDQVYTDMPEYRRHPNPAFQNERVRGTGGFDITSFGEENLLNLPLDRYDDESIAVHEFCHTIDAALRRIDPAWQEKKTKVYQHAVDQGLYKYAYAGSNSGEYWAEICQAYFDCNRVNNWNHASVGSREQLLEYDPQGFELVRDTFRLTAENDWRFRPLQTQPSVISPPNRFKFPAYYQKFTWAREFPVLGSSRVTSESMLRANQLIRRMFAYRHDILKALIVDGARVVVLAPEENLLDLPEFEHERSAGAFASARYYDYDSEKKLIVVPEETLRATSFASKWEGGPPMAGRICLVGLMAKAAYRVAGLRPVDEKLNTLRRDSQQYEQRLLWNQKSEPIARLDLNFDLRIRDLHAQALEAGLWKGTPAARDKFEYWASGVEAYFDASGSSYAPDNHPTPIRSREQLHNYDPGLWEAVHQTFYYQGRADWRVAN